MRVPAKLISFIITRRPVLVKSPLFECEAAADATVGEGDSRLLNVYHVPDRNTGRDLDCCVHRLRGKAGMLLDNQSQISNVSDHLQSCEGEEITHQRRRDLNAIIQPLRLFA